MSPAIADALDDVPWKEVLKIPGAPTSHCLLLHRLKGARLTGWSAAHGAVMCPHCPTAGTRGGQLDHIFWECPSAQRLWTSLRARWDHLSSRQHRWDDSGFLSAVFRLRLTNMPDLLWGNAELTRLPTPTPEDTSATHQALQAVWRLQVLATLHTIWRWRTDADEPNQIWQPAEAMAYLSGCLQATLVRPQWTRTHDSAASCHTAAALEILRRADPDSEIRPADPSLTSDLQYVLFFDGGSRGNPGPGGSGAVIVLASHRATQASIVWSAAMSAAASTTTNNQAEYTGVVAGLRAARANNWTPLEVVGDSQLILRQLRDYRPPLNVRLRTHYAEARRLGDALGVHHWNHHLRAYNKMADAAANAAMDTRSSSQVTHPTTRTGHVALAQHLHSDFVHWQATFFARTSSR